MADDNINPHKPFDDYVHSTTDEVVTNLSQGLNKKVDIPTSLADSKAMIFNASTNRFEASYISNSSIDPAAAINVSKLLGGAAGSVLTSQTANTASWNTAMLKYYEAICSLQLTLTTANQDVTGATVTFTTNGANAVVVMLASFNFAIGSTGTGVCSGAFAIDGTDTTTGLAVMNDISSTTISQTHCSHRITSLATPGSHTIKLRAKKSINAGTAVVGTNSAITLLVFDP